MIRSMEDPTRAETSEASDAPREEETSRIMTINMKCTGCKGEGAAAKRKDLIISTIKRSSASVIFCQEAPGNFKNGVVAKCGDSPSSYKFVPEDIHSSKKDNVKVAVMWRETSFEGEKVDLTEPSITKIEERLKHEKSVADVKSMVQVSKERSAMVKLTSRGTTKASFLAVSWHGPRKVNKASKKTKLEDLIRLLRVVCEKEELSSFIIGGDFNLNTSDIDKRTETDCEVVISRDYLLCNRDRERQLLTPRPGRPIVFYKDNFIVSSPSDKYPMTGNVRVFWVEALEFESYESSENEPLDHAPVVGVLELDKLLYTYKKPSIKQDRGKLEQYFQSCTSRPTFVYITKL